MNTTSTTKPDDVKRRALKLVTHASKKADRATSERAAAWRYAAEQGASTREIADADGTVSHMTIQRTLADDA
jgi:hypothetical protein